MDTDLVPTSNSQTPLSARSGRAAFVGEIGTEKATIVHSIQSHSLASHILASPRLEYHPHRLDDTQRESMVSIESRFKSQLAQFWKDDFAPLRAAGQTVDAVLREEESAPDADLYRRIATVSAGSHLYFSEGQSVRWKHVRSVAPPDYLLQELEGVQRQLLMGILAEAGLAWITVDDKLYLWHFRDGDQGMVLRFQVPDGQCIVSVGLAPPREGAWGEAASFDFVCCFIAADREISSIFLLYTTSISSNLTSSQRMIHVSLTPN